MFIFNDVCIKNTIILIHKIDNSTQKVRIDYNILLFYTGVCFMYKIIRLLFFLLLLLLFVSRIVIRIF